MPEWLFLCAIHTPVVRLAQAGRVRLVTGCPGVHAERRRESAGFPLSTREAPALWRRKPQPPWRKVVGLTAKTLLP